MEASVAAAADHPGEDSFHVWGPVVPADFITNQSIPPDEQARRKRHVRDPNGIARNAEKLKSSLAAKTLAGSQNFFLTNRPPPSHFSHLFKRDPV
jgi:hypothetical protein